MAGWPTLQKFDSKCAVVPLPIDLGHWRRVESEDAMAFKRSLGLGTSKLVLFVGRLVYYKGLDYLVEAMRDVSARLIVVGQGPEELRLRRKVEEMGLGERIIFAGFVPDEQLVWYYNIADVFVLPSTSKAEMYGIVQMEAMACGVPIVNTQLDTGVNFVSPHGQTGLTVPPRDVDSLSLALNELLNNRTLTDQYSHNALTRVEMFSSEKVVEQFHHIYQLALR
jgi:rhamnosyl/mannosyltransferase